MRPRRRLRATPPDTPPSPNGAARSAPVEARTSVVRIVGAEPADRLHLAPCPSRTPGPLYLPLHTQLAKTWAPMPPAFRPGRVTWGMGAWGHRAAAVRGAPSPALARKSAPSSQMRPMVSQWASKKRMVPL